MRSTARARLEAMADYELIIHRMPMADTGIGQEMGHESDAAFLAAQREEQMALGMEMHAAVEQVGSDVMRAFLFGR